MSFFKAYDMRGKFGTDFTLDTVRKVGRFLPSVVAAHAGTAPRRPGPFRILIGRDARMTSTAVRDALVAGLSSAGAEVTDIGQVTTPMVYFFTAREDFDASVQITASHNPPEDNGLKVSRRTALPVGYESGLSEIEAHVNADTETKYVPAADTKTPAVVTDAVRLESYCEWMNALQADFSGLKFAVDCSDGMAGIFAHRLFGPDATYLNDLPDGRFPHHSPNPLAAEAREQAANVVRAGHLDCGVIFDGDADRVMFVDENGDFIQPDFLIPILAETFKPDASCYLPSPPPDPLNAARPANDATPFTVIHDVRTSRAAIEALRGMGAKTVMGKVGHAYAKVLLRETGAVCGGELAGHYYFRDFFGCDSGALAALRILHAFAQAKRDGLTVSARLAPINRKYANSGEVNFRVDDKPAAIARVLKAAAGLSAERGRSEIDGVRLEFDEGWVSVRQSNTESLLRLLVECDTHERMDAWLKTLSAAVTA